MNHVYWYANRWQVVRLPSATAIGGYEGQVEFKDCGGVVSAFNIAEHLKERKPS